MPRTLRLTVARCGEALKTLLICAADSEATLPFLRPWALALSTSGFDMSMQEAWSSLLVRCSASVVKYTLNQDESRHEFFHPPTLPAFVPISLPLSRFENLQHVHIWTTYDHFRSSEFQVLPHLARELKDIAAGKAARMPSELSHISFTINLNAIRITYLRTAALVVANRGTWNEVNALLSSPAFARMKRLGLQYEAELGIIHDVAFWRIAREVLWKQLGDLKRKCAVVVGLTRLENVLDVEEFNADVRVDMELSTSFSKAVIPTAIGNPPKSIGGLLPGNAPHPGAAYVRCSYYKTLEDVLAAVLHFLGLEVGVEDVWGAWGSFANERVGIDGEGYESENASGELQWLNCETSGGSPDAFNVVVMANEMKADNSGPGACQDRGQDCTQIWIHSTAAGKLFLLPPGGE
ncbi:hypothetical protein NMY22_g996 [Coprinellus aureogranulatus]|nr:hypothetical protein NMY22_g996 [Coprinellus aureogranulatus]